MWGVSRGGTYTLVGERAICGTRYLLIRLATKTGSERVRWHVSRHVHHNLDVEECKVRSRVASNVLTSCYLPYFGTFP